MLDHLRQDVSYAVRGLKRSPAFTAVIVGTFALGVGANAAVFSFLDRLLLKPPAGVVNPGEIRRLYGQHPGRRSMPEFGGADAWFMNDEFTAIQAKVKPIANVAAYTQAESTTVKVGNTDFLAHSASASAGFLPMLGVRTATGRFFTEDEDRLDAGAKVVVLSHRFWRRVLGADSSIIGHSIDIGPQRCVVIGVIAAGFDGIDIDPVDVWLPLNTHDTATGGHMMVRSMQIPRLVARVAAGTDPKKLEAGATIAYRAPRSNEGFKRFGDEGDSLRSVITGPILASRGPSKLSAEVSIGTRLAGVAAIILLIACANAATLLLMRWTARRREIAVRLALGVTRVRLVTQLLTEGAILAVTGGIAALIIGSWGGSALRALLLPAVQWNGSVLDARLIVFTLAATFFAGLLAAVPPAIQAGRTDFGQSLKAGVREGVFQRSRLRSGLVVLQAALSLVLLVGAGLFVRSLRSVESIDLGIQIERLLTVFVNPADENQMPEIGRVLTAEAEALRHIPGVESVALGGPPMGMAMLMGELSIPGRDSVPTLNGMPPTGGAGGSPGYFSTVGMRILEGRDFAPDDAVDSFPPRVMVVNSSMAHVLWPGESAVGKCMKFGPPTTACTNVIGVVSDSHLARLIEKPMMLYFFPQSHRFAALGFVVRVVPKQRVAVAAQLQRDLRRTLPATAKARVMDFATQLDPELRPWRLGATLFTLLGILALVVAGMGVYSVVAYSVSQRTHELGVRIALGAQAGDVLRLVLGEGFRIAAIGVACGIVLALALAQLVETLLYGVSARDPLTIVGATVLLLAVGLVASVLPARRASRVDPTVALRAD